MNERNQSKKNYNSEKGITLIALIITVILLLILSLVSLDIVFDGKVFDKARDVIGKANSQSTQIEEQENIATTKWDEATGKPIKGGTQTNLCPPHEYGDWGTAKAATCTTSGEKIRTCINCGKTQVAKIESLGHNYEDGICSNCKQPEHLLIGAKINYQEYIDPTTGLAFTNMPNYTSKTDKTGYDKDQEFKVLDNSNIEWIVLGEEGNQIKITTSSIIKTADNKTYYLKGQDGYANFVNELDAISAIYGKGRYADRARSFRMEDLGFEELTRTDGYKYVLHPDNKVYRYSWGSTDYGIDSDYELDIMTGQGGTFSTCTYMGLDASDSTKEENYEWYTLGEGTNPTRISIYQYSYTGNNTLLSNHPNVAKTGTYNNYWLASRKLLFWSERYLCQASTVNGSAGTTSASTLFYSNGYNADEDVPNQYYGIRPIVYLNPNIELTYDSENGYTIVTN